MTTTTDATLPRWQQAPAPPAPQRGRSVLQQVATTAVLLVAPVAWGARSAALALVVAWTVVALLLAAWVAPERPVLRRLPAPGPGALPAVLVLTAVSAWSAVAGHALWRSVVPYALALLMPLLTRLGGGAVERAAAWFGRTVGNAVAAVLFGALGLLVVALPWGVQRVLRIDPLGSTPGWSRRLRRNVEAAQPWAPSPVLRAPSRAAVVRNVALTGIAVAVLVAATPVGRRAVATLTGTTEQAAKGFELTTSQATRDKLDGVGLPIRDRVPDGVTETPFDPNGRHAAMATSTWMDGFFGAAQGWALNPRNAWRPVNPHRLRDFESPNLTVHNGERRTWTPPPGPRPRLRVWMFGGSTTYGLNQRDDHTIASELARVAHDHGVDLEIHNKGMNGHLQWIEAERFAWDLSTEAKPDLVMFYDGVNDIWEGGTLNRFATGDVPTMYDPTLLDAWINGTKADQQEVPAAPPGGRLVGRREGPVLPLVTEARTTVARYERARTISRATAAANGIPALYFWQPSRFSRPIVMSEPHHDTSIENRSRLAEQLRVKFLPKDVISVVDALRSNTDPLFTDDVHHNETGARLIAEAMFSKIRPQLELLAAAKGTTP